MEEITGQSHEEQPCRFDVTVVPTADELYYGMCDGELRRAGKTRLIVQSVLLLAAAVWSLAPLFFGGDADWFLMTVAVAVCAAMWLVPPLRMKADARAQANDPENRFRLRGYEDGLGVGSAERFTFLPFAGLEVRVRETQLTLLVDSALLVIPKRGLPADCWTWLCAACRKDEE